jgi:dTDP-4-dehydrorhamnose reductase
MTWIILGAAGQLGRSLQDTLKCSGQSFIALSSKALDVTNAGTLDQILYQSLPSVIINCANYIPRNSSNLEAMKAERVNVSAPEQLAHWCTKNNAWLIHLSSDLVFSSRKYQQGANAFNELDTPNSTSAYGRLKHAGELTVTNNCSRHIVIRHSWLFSKYNQNFIDSCLNGIHSAHTPYKRFSETNNPIITPVHAPDLAKTIIQIATMTMASALISGTYHYAGHQSINLKNFINQVCKAAKSQGLIFNSTPKIDNENSSTTYEDFSLCTQKIQQLGIQPSNWDKGLVEVMADHAYHHTS